MVEYIDSQRLYLNPYLSLPKMVLKSKRYKCRLNNTNTRRVRRLQTTRNERYLRPYHRCFRQMVTDSFVLSGEKKNRNKNIIRTSK